MGEPSPRRVLSVMHGNVFGGAHNQLIRLDPWLRAAGFESIAVLPPAAADAAARIEAAGIRTIRIPLRSFRMTADPRVHLESFGNLRRDVGSLRGAIRTLDVDLVQAHGVVNPHAAIAADLEDAAVVWQLLDTRAPMPVRRVVMPYATRVADAITSWGRALAETHPGALSLGDRTIIVFPPLSPDLRFDPQTRAAGRSRLGIEGEELVVGTLGGRSAYKGHEYFVRAAAQIHQRHPSAVFRLLGSANPGHAEYNRAVEAEAEQLGLRRPEQIDFIDPGTKATELVQALDVFVMTSVPHSEGMPTAILEAMALGKPVVSTDVGAVRELVADGETGFVVAPSDPDALAQATLRLLGDGDLRERFGSAARERAGLQFDLERLAELHATAYERALAHRAARRGGRI